MKEIRAIEVDYKNYKFRSTLEARWAVFFQALGLRWIYEPGGFMLPSGNWYLPDFKLEGFCGREPYENKKSKILWCEVKGVSDYDDLVHRRYDDYRKVREFSRVDEIHDYSEIEQLNPIIVLPNIPEDTYDWWHREVTTFSFVDMDFDWPCVISKNDLFSSRFCLCGPDGDSYPTKEEEYFTNEALKRARQVRFDHGYDGDFEPINIYQNGYEIPWS